MLKNYSKRIAIAMSAAALCALLLSGCGGGGGGSSSTPGPNSGTTQGHELLNQIISAGGTPSTASLNTALADFEAGVAANPNDKDAQAGFAITHAALCGINFANALGSSSSAVHAHTGARSHADSVAQITQGLIIWKMPSLINQGASQLPSAVELLPSVFTSHTSSGLTPLQVQAQLVTLDDCMAEVENALNVVLSDPNYVFTITDSAHSTSTKLGSAEFRVFATFVAIVRSVANSGTAYSADYGNFDFNANISTLGPLTNGEHITPAQYLPSSPFATLKSDGAARMHTVQTELNRTFDNATAAAAILKTRNSSGFLLNPGTVITASQFDQFIAQANGYKTYVNGTGSVTIDFGGTPTPTTINLPAIFNNPPADLKSLAGTYTVEVNGGQTFLTTDNNSYPDRTFGGLFPNSINTNQSFEVTSSTTLGDLAISGVNLQFN